MGTLLILFAFSSCFLSKVAKISKKRAKFREKCDEKICKQYYYVVTLKNIKSYKKYMKGEKRIVKKK